MSTSSGNAGVPGGSEALINSSDTICYKEEWLTWPHFPRERLA